ncbi:MAG: hypothetical protein FWG93_00070 [Oscillospiraceae bacterium]|nr:hypothetical protein [Oscillospiraceae bacterium]
MVNALTPALGGLAARAGAALGYGGYHYGPSPENELMSELFYHIYVFFLDFLEKLCGFYEILAGTRTVVYNGQRMVLVDILFNHGAVSYAFWGVTLIGIALAIFFSILAVSKRMVEFKGEGLGPTLGQIGRTLLSFLLVPLLAFGLVRTGAIVLNATDDLFANNYEANLPGYIFATTATSAGLYQGGQKGHIDDALRKPYLTGAKRYDNVAAVKRDFNLGLIDSLSGIFLCVALGAIYVFIFVLLIVSLFGIVLHYIVSPLFVATMALGDPEMFMRWLRSFIPCFFTGYGLLLSYKIIIYIIIPFLSSGVVFSADPLGDILLKFLFVFGMVYSAYKNAGTLAQMLNPDGQSDETMVLGTAGSIASGGLKIAWAAAKSAGKAALKLGVNAATGGLDMLADMGSMATSVASEAVKGAAEAVTDAAAGGGGGDGGGSEEE